MLGDQTCQIQDDCDDPTLCKDGFYICFLEKCVCIPTPKVITCNIDDDCVKNCPPDCGCFSAKCRIGKCNFMCKKED